MFFIAVRGNVTVYPEGVKQPSQGATPLVYGSCSGKRPYGPSGCNYGRPSGA